MKRVVGLCALAIVAAVAFGNQVRPDTTAVVQEALKANPPALDGREKFSMLKPPQVSALASTNVHLGGKREIVNPLAKTDFRCVLMGHGPASPWRFYASVGEDGKAVYPFDADKHFAKVLAAEDTSKWTDEKFLDAAKLYVHLKSPANEDGWLVLNKPEDFMAISFNMPKAGTPQHGKRQEDAKKITAPVVERRKDGVVVVKFFAWKLIGGIVQEWTVEFGKEFKPSMNQVARWGGGGYD